MGHHIEFLKLREGHEPQPDRDLPKKQKPLKSSSAA